MNPTAAPLSPWNIAHALGHGRISLHKTAIRLTNDPRS